MKMEQKLIEKKEQNRGKKTKIGGVNCLGFKKFVF